MLLLTYIKNIKFNKYTYFKRKGLFFMIKIIKMTIFRYYIRLAQKIKIYLAYSKIKFLNEIQYKIYICDSSFFFQMSRKGMKGNMLKYKQ